MAIFNLPDLGEGITEAEIHEWHVKEGDVVKSDQVLVSMETAKAVVDVPSPRAGKIKKLYGSAGDVMQSHSPLLEFEAEGNVDAAIPSEAATTSSAPANSEGRIKILPAVRQLAQQLKVDLTHIQATGPQGQITADDVRKAAAATTQHLQPLKGVRRSMAQAMIKSHAEVVPVTLVDDADLHAWPEGTDVTMRLLRAIVRACQAEPTLNASFHTAEFALERHEHVHIGIAMDTPDGLFVPVLKHAETRTAEVLREELNQFKSSVRSREIAPNDLQGATITLSNFGVFAGRYANPIVVPPSVAIIGAGKVRTEPVWNNGKFEAHAILPLSLSIDHRAVTGGEASRFLKTMLEDLALSS